MNVILLIIIFMIVIAIQLVISVGLVSLIIAIHAKIETICKQIHQNANQLVKYIDGEMKQIERVNGAMMNATVVKMIVLRVVIHVMVTRF